MYMLKWFDPTDLLIGKFYFKPGLKSRSTKLVEPMALLCCNIEFVLLTKEGSLQVTPYRLWIPNFIKRFILDNFLDFLKYEKQHLRKRF